jgi:hypothetical protein
MERISGPVDGYYVVSYACEVGEFGHEFVGYTKLCAQPPENFWDADGQVVCSERRFADAGQAMNHSETLALGHRPSPQAQLQPAATAAGAGARRAGG